MICFAGMDLREVGVRSGCPPNHKSKNTGFQNLSALVHERLVRPLSCPLRSKILVQLFLYNYPSPASHPQANIRSLFLQLEPFGQHNSEAHPLLETNQPIYRTTNSNNSCVTSIFKSPIKHWLCRATRHELNLNSWRIVYLS